MNLLDHPVKRKRMIRSLALAASMALAPQLSHSVIFGKRHFSYSFNSEKRDPAVRFSPEFISTAKGLQVSTSSPFSEIWVETPPTAVGTGDRLLSAMGLSLTVEGKFADALVFPREAFVRYSSDGLHWTSWQAFVDLDDEKDSAGINPRRFKANLVVPEGQRERYNKLADEWRSETKEDDERKLEKWLREKHSDLLASELPYIGFLQIRLEGTSTTDTSDLLASLDLEGSFATGGFRKLFK